MRSAIAFIDEATLVDGAERVPAEVKAALTTAGVELRPYAAISSALAALPRGANATVTDATAGAGTAAAAEAAAAASAAGGAKGESLWIDPSGCSFAIAGLVEGLDLVESRSPLQALKAVKSPAELACMQQCHLRDSAALCRFYAWLDSTMTEGTIAVDEVSAAEQLEVFRSADPAWKGQSFATISSAGANGTCVPHLLVVPTGYFHARVYARLCLNVALVCDRALSLLLPIPSSSSLSLSLYRSLYRCLAR